MLVATGKLDGLLQALVRFSTRLKVVEAAKEDRLAARSTRSWGPALVFGRLWQQQDLPEILERLAEGRKFEFDPERVAFALALQRLVAPGSDLQGAAWTETVEAPGFAELALHPLLPHPAVAGSEPPGARAGAVLPRPRPVLGRARSGVRRHHLGLSLPRWRE